MNDFGKEKKIKILKQIYLFRQGMDTSSSDGK
jgi:hypothetical protein